MFVLWFKILKNLSEQGRAFLNNISISNAGSHIIQFKVRIFELILGTCNSYLNLFTGRL